MFKFLVRFLRKLQLEYRRYRSQHWGSWWNFRHGFLPKTIDICGINKDNFHEFVSDVDYRKGHPYNGIYSSIIDNKLYLPLLLHDFKQYIPQYYFFKDESGFLPLYTNQGIRVEANEVLIVLHGVGSLVCKRVADSLGSGFVAMNYHDEKYYVNGEQVEKEKLIQLLNGLNHYIITETVQNHEYASNIAPNSLNTIRFLFVWDADKKTFVLPRVFHRFGCNGSIVDNLGAGNGVCVFVDPQTGVLKKEGVISIDNKETPVVDNDIIHPNNDKLLSGLIIPNYKQLKHILLQICNCHSYLRYIGLDVAVTKDSFKIIEINSLSSLSITQQHEGFLLDSRIKRVLKR